jgi:hypothetical protein
VVLTFIGVALAAGLAWAMVRWDERSGLLQAGEPTGDGQRGASEG